MPFLIQSCPRPLFIVLISFALRLYSTERYFDFEISFKARPFLFISVNKNVPVWPQKYCLDKSLLQNNKMCILKMVQLKKISKLKYLYTENFAQVHVESALNIFSVINNYCSIKLPIIVLDDLSLVFEVTFQPTVPQSLNQ